MHIHINGVQINETVLNYTLTNTTKNADICTIGNSLDYKDPLNAYIRHLIFLNTGLASNASLSSRMRYV